ncbi:VanZ family protein [uncultured Salinisphaera sp.]|uniref:VanZ family protein n=1 Tax=uncultured Salinisphaera sp. TaxID=359372 RepID=UPI0032B10AA5|tara:strand:- start:5062 stop:6192 length:1131 start_codon:yes stop_codon:yes gene_type:complete
MTTRYVWAAVLAAGFIAYGSLTPFDWYSGASAHPLAFVLSRWDTPHQPLSGWLANIALYVPLGLFISLARAPRGSHARRLLWSGLLALSLCFSIELIQVYDWGRQATLTDVYPNVIGALLGAELAWRLPVRLQQPVGDFRQPFTLCLLGAFFVGELYPFIPTLNLAWHRDALFSLWQHPHIEPEAFVLAFLRWLLSGLALRQLFGAQDGWRGWWVVVAAVFAGQIVMLDVWLSISEWSAVLVAACTLAAVRGVTARRVAGIASLLVLAGLVYLMGGGDSADTQATLQPLAQWASADMATLARRMLALFLVVGGLLWCLLASGLSSGRATGLAVGVLALAAFLGAPPGSALARLAPAVCASVIGAALMLGSRWLVRR